MVTLIFDIVDKITRCYSWALHGKSLYVKAEARSVNSSFGWYKCNVSEDTYYYYY